MSNTHIMSKSTNGLCLKLILNADSLTIRLRQISLIRVVTNIKSHMMICNVTLPSIYKYRPFFVCTENLVAGPSSKTSFIL